MIKRVALGIALPIGVLGIAILAVTVFSRAVSGPEPLFTIEHTTEIDASPAHVWSILLDLERWPEWNTYAIGVEVEGEVAIGTRLVVTIVQDDWPDPLVVTPVLTRLDPGRELGWHGSLGLEGVHETDHYFQLDPLPTGGTRFHHAEEFRGWLAGLVPEEADRIHTLHAFERMNADLKARAESTD